jgi:hypothetical protein
MEKSTLHTDFLPNGIPINVPNKITSEGQGYHISYNNCDIWHYGCPTTALYINETEQFLILNNNHSEAYKKFETLHQCIDYFYANIDQANCKSEHGKIFAATRDGDKILGFGYIEGGY